MKVSVILPTYNESSGIAGALESLRNSMENWETEVVVADGSSRDGTAEAAIGLCDKLVRLDRAGRAYQMHCGAEASSGEILLFLHADTRLPAGWRGRLESLYRRDPNTVGSAFRLRFDSERPVYRFIETLSRARQFFTRVPHGDQAIAVRRDAYFKAGGFCDAPLMEEYVLHRRLQKLGRIHFFKDCVATSTRRYERTGPLRRALMNSFMIVCFHLGVPPNRLAALYG